MDQHAVRLQKAPLLARDLGLHAFVIAPARVRLPELRRPEEPAVLYTVERGVRQEVEGARLTGVDAMMLEPLPLEISAVDRDRFGAEPQQQSREPRLEQRGASARRG